ncbi:hypothetical protein [Flectobacillus major]|jgi:hypothetical protein|uniref:hypothetical protein n=1 Tax=Flectobacillus major TaxID=103 RepID=UPI0004194FED|nr:hypothetical protein [Flectobacillus major]
MKKSHLFFLSILFSSLSIYAQTKADSVMYLAPYVVVGPKSSQVNIIGNYGLYVPKGVLTEKVRVAVKNTSGWADYVFKPEYKLSSLDKVKSYIKENGHLPDVPSTETVLKDGIDIADNQRLLLQKIEEMTLYILQQEDRIKKLEYLATKKKHSYKKNKRNHL